MKEKIVVPKAAYSILFSNVWEDADIACEALKPKAKNGRLLSIGETGDLVFSLLTLDPQEVVAVDPQISQLACLELRMAAYRELNHTSMLAFLGVTSSSNRLIVYQQLRRDLTDHTALFWDRHSNEIEEGIIHSGKIEKKMRFFSRYVLSWIHSQAKTETFLSFENIEEQKKFYEKKWNSWLWRLCFGLAFNEYTSVERLNQVVNNVPNETNPYIHYILEGNYQIDALPRALRPEFFDQIQSKISAIRLANVPIELADKGNFDGFNLGTYFDQFQGNDAQRCYEALLKRANPEARLVWWSRQRKPEIVVPVDGKSQFLDELTKKLFKQDKSWLSQSLYVHEVI